MTNLSSFFDRMHGLVTGRLSPDEVVEALGPSPSGKERLGHYRTLVRRQRELLMRAFYPATEAALEAFHPGLFLETVGEVARTRPPTSGDPNRFAEPMPDVLEQKALRGEVPDWAAEIADLELCHYHARFAPRPEDLRDPGLDRTLFVRRYSHDVLETLHRVFGGQSGCETALVPRAAPISVIVCRRVGEDDPFVFHPSVAALCVLAERAGERLAAPVSRGDLDAAERQLVAWRVLEA